MTIWVAISGAERWGKLEANSFHICNGIETVCGGNGHNPSTKTTVGCRGIVWHFDSVRTKGDGIDAYAEKT